MISSHTKSLLTTLVVTAVVLLAVLVIGVYNIRDKNNKTSELLNLADEAAEAGVLVQSIRILQNDAREDLESFDKLILSNDKLVPLIEDIEKTGRGFDLETNILSVGEVGKSGSVEPQTLRIALEAQGSWSGELSFLKAIESLPYRVMIEETDFQKKETGWHLKVVLALHLFN